MRWWQSQNNTYPEYLNNENVMKSKMLKFILFSFFAMITTNSCKTDKKDSVSPFANQTQVAIYTIGFQESNKDQGVVVISLIQTPDRQLIIENSAFRYNEKDAGNVRALCEKFYRNLLNNSPSLSGYKNMEDYILQTFQSPKTFKNIAKLKNENLYKLINNQSFSLASLNEKSKNNDFLFSLLSSFVPSAMAQGNIEGVLTQYFGAILGVWAGTIVSVSGLPLLPALAFGAAVAIGYNVLTGQQTTSYDIFPGFGRLDQAAAQVTFGAGKIANELNKLFDPINRALGGPNYSPPNPLPETWEDLADGFGKWFDNFLNFLKNNSSFGQSGGSSWGDPHINTFDGLSYDFQAWGEFVAVKSTVDNFEVQVRQVGIENAPVVSFNRGLAVQTGSDVVCYVEDKLYINNQIQSQNFVNLTLKDNASLSITKDSRNIELLSIKSKYGDIITIPKYSYDYKIQLSDSRKNKIVGLFGNYDGIKENELNLKNGTLITLESTKTVGISVEVPFKQMYPSYADSWRVEQKNSLFYYSSGKSTETYTQKDYPKESFSLTSENRLWAEGVCKNAGVNKEPFLSACIMDVALTKDKTLASSSLWSQQNQINSDILQVSTSSSTKPIDGRWEYYSNNNGGCTDLITTIVNLKDGLGIIEKVPITPYAFAVGDTLFKGIYFKSDNIYTTNFALAKSVGGAKSYYKADITLKTNGEILMTYIGVCNPSQNWRKK
jgi:von Willebrand factor type D domain